MHSSQKEAETEGPDMFIFDGPQGGLFRTDGITRWPVRSTAFLDVARVRHVGTLSAAAFSVLRDGNATVIILRADLEGSPRQVPPPAGAPAAAG